MHVTALLTVLNRFGHPLPQGRDAADVVLRPAAEVEIGSPVKLGRDGGVSVPVRVRCQRPWVDAELSLSVAQNGGTLVGSAAGDFGIVCDAAWHSLRVRVVPAADPFRVGRAQVDASITVYEPESLDPVDQGGASGQRWVSRW